MSSLLERQEGPFYDQWEALPQDQKNTRQRLADYISFARSLEFYRDRLQAVDMDADFPLKNVPILEPQHLRETLPPLSTALLTGPNTSHTVFQSGGTTGIPKTSLFSHEELEGLNLPNARGFYGTGMTAEDNVANLWAVGGLYMTFVHINRMLQQYGCTSYPFSNQTPVDFIATVAERFGINVFTGITSVVLNALREIHSQKIELKVDKIYFGGEHIYEADRLEMQEKFGTKIIAAPGYGTVDTWYLGYQCSHTPPGAFHVHDDQVYLEIVDEDADQHAAPGEVGMLYATAFPRRLTPIIRYRVGDRVFWHKESCPCGRTTPVFQLLGRGDDVLRIGYDSIDYNAIQNLVTKIPGLTGMVQMEKSRLDGKDLLAIRVEADLDRNEFDNAKQKLEAVLLEDRPSLRDFVKKGTIHPIVIEIKGQGELPTNPRTGKLIRVIDAI